MPFLTDIDSRAAIKGSRDPLGLVPLWSRFGRHVVGNLTTVSNSLRGFTTLLLGYYFAEEALKEHASDSENTLELFLKFEQLAGYARFHVHGDDDFRGRDRVAARLAKESKITLGADSHNQILSNQRIYGLWGLFSVPARTSGLLARDETILSSAARVFVEKQYVPRLSPAGLRGTRAIVDLLRRKQPTIQLDRRDASLASAIAGLFSTKITATERSFYIQYLVHGGDDDKTQGCQPLLADLLGKLPTGSDFGIPELHATKKEARKLADDGRLATHLEAIGKLESLLVPMENAFAFLLSRNGKDLSSVASDIRRTWGGSLRHVDTEAIASQHSTICSAFNNDARAADRIVSTSSALSEGSYEDALRMLVEHNAFIMQARSGSPPWIQMNGTKLDVRYRDESALLIPGDELPQIWRNTYFINSLHSVVSSLKAE